MPAARPRAQQFPCSGHLEALGDGFACFAARDRLWHGKGARKLTYQRVLATKSFCPSEGALTFAGLQRNVLFALTANAQHSFDKDTR